MTGTVKTAGVFLSMRARAGSAAGGAGDEGESGGDGVFGRDIRGSSSPES